MLSTTDRKLDAALELEVLLRGVGRVVDRRTRDAEVSSLSGLRADDTGKSVAAYSIATCRRFESYVELIERTLDSSGSEAAESDATIQIALCVLMAELRVFAEFIAQTVGDTLAVAFEAELFSLLAHELATSSDHLAKSGAPLAALRMATESIGLGLAVESRRFFEHAPSPEKFPLGEADRLSLRRALVQLGGALERDLSLILSCGARSHISAKSARLLDQLRSDAWSMRHLIRAFLYKFPLIGAPESWTERSPTEFIDSFLMYAKLYARPLCQITAYPNMSELVGVFDILGDPSGLTEVKKERVLQTLRALDLFLTELCSKLDAELASEKVAFNLELAATRLRERFRINRENYSHKMTMGAQSLESPTETRTAELYSSPSSIP